MVRRRRCFCSCILSLVLVLWYSVPAVQATESIQVWYGEKQQFGFPGLAQPWVNILGCVSDYDQVSSLSYRVNEGATHSLNIGPDCRRLSAPGDFNIEIDAELFHSGNNRIDITRTLKDNSRDVRRVTVDYQSRPWPLPYRVKWAEVVSIQDAVQVVDGIWEKTGSGIRTAPDSVGYDRAVAIGDAAWSSYEILVPFTLNGVDSSAYDSPESVSPGLGLILHWNGHTHSPIDCGQPHCGWFPVGAMHWYVFPKSGQGGFHINTRSINDLSVALPYPLEIGKTYLLRSQVTTSPFTIRYFLKVWRQGEEEPSEWSLQQTADRKNQDHGGVLMVAHHVDLTIGNIEVKPISGAEGKGATLRDSLTVLPQALSMLAGFLFLCVAGLKKEFRCRNRVFGVAVFLAAMVLLIYLEPILPVLLRHYHVPAAMSAALYLVYDIGFVFLQIMIWILIFFSGFTHLRKNYLESRE